MTTTPPLARTPPARTRLALPATFNFDWIRTFLTLRRVWSLERWTDDDTYTRSVWIDGSSALLTIRYVTPDRLDISFTADPPLTPAMVRAAVTRMFDVDGDLETFIAHVRRDKLLGPLVKRRPHVRLPRLLDPFEGLVRAMLGQQVTVRAASTMTDRLTRRFGTLIGVNRPQRGAAAGGADAEADAIPEAEAEALYAFPRPEVVAAAGPEVLRAIGLTRAKAAAIAKLAETLASGRLDCARLAGLPSDDVQAALVALPGIGPWTASYVRMRVLGDRDAFPAADLGVIKALEAFGIARADQAAAAERWRPWRAYAVVHLWESLGD